MPPSTFRHLTGGASQMKVILLIIMLCFILIVLTGCTNNKEYSIEDKITEEIKKDAGTSDVPASFLF